MPKPIPRPEYPRPTLVRDGWTNLNGRWRFAFDHGLSGIEEKWFEKHNYAREIVVPFCPESRLSGIGDRDWHPGAWYEREVAVPRLGSRRFLLHFGACDYETTVFVNGVEVDRHGGGYTPFTFDATAQVKPGPNRVTVFARDDLRSRVQPAGKQSARLESYGCSYTRTTGIWQTVWAECVPHVHVERVVAQAQADLRTVNVEIDLAGGASQALVARIEARAGGRVVASAETACVGGTRVAAALDIPGARRWSPADPFLYDLAITLVEGGRVVDRVASYFGVRSVALTDREVLLNGAPVYLKLILDQGFYPDGVYTAPTDRALRRDIELSLAAGYNGARLHQKVFEPRFLYWADRLGYLCWGEAADWGARYDSPVAQNNLRSDWTEIVRRDVMHPSIIAWTAANEQQTSRDGDSRRRACGSYFASLQRMIKQMDPTRPAIDNSGYWHTSTDILDLHDYSAGDATRKTWSKFRRTNRAEDIRLSYVPVMWPGWPVPNAPVVLSEVGGIGFVAPGAKGWGYGQIPKTRGAFIKRFADTMRAIMEIENVCGFCYTQLTDVEQEINGLYTFDRKPKFDIRAIRKIHSGRR